MINTQQKYLLTNNLVSEVIDNKQLRKKQYFDIVMSKLLSYHLVNKKYLVNLVKQNLNDSDKQILQLTKSDKKYYDKIQNRINQLVKASEIVVLDELHNYMIDKTTTKEEREKIKKRNNNKRFIFLEEFEKQKHLEHIYTIKEKKRIEVDYEFEKDSMNMFDKSSDRYFSISRDTNNNRKRDFTISKDTNKIINIIDLDKLKENEEEEFYTTITLARLHDKHLNRYKKIVNKKRRELLSDKKVKQNKTIDIDELITVIKSLSSSS